MSSPVMRALVNPAGDPALDVFLHWCDSKAVRPIPMAPADIAVFVKQAQTLGIEKVADTVAAISQLYLSRGLADPTAGGPVSDAINQIAPVDPPRSWSKEDWPLFYALPYPVQVILRRREAERDKRLRQAQNEAATTRKELAEAKKQPEPIKSEAA